MKSDGDVLSAGRPPARSIMSIDVPPLVVVGTLGVIGGSAWPTLRPVREVRVVQAGLVPESVAHGERSPEGGTSHASSPSSGRLVQAAGWLEGEPYDVACVALTDGVLETIEVLEGDAVRAGQIVGTLVDGDHALRLARAEGERVQSEAMLDSARAELRAAEIGVTLWLTNSRIAGLDPIALKRKGTVPRGSAMTLNPSG